MPTGYATMLSFWSDRDVANPGSPEALLIGCTCPSDPNPEFFDDGEGIEWNVAGDCPVHAPIAVGFAGQN
jgi:hypothetical protein